MQLTKNGVSVSYSRGYASEVNMFGTAILELAVGDQVSTSHCLRINRNGNFISWDFFHVSSFIHNRDNLDMQENLRFHGEFLRNLKICK